MQTDLALYSYHIQGVAVDENDETSAVSINTIIEHSGKDEIKFVMTCLFFHRFPAARHLQPC